MTIQKGPCPVVTRRTFVRPNPDESDDLMSVLKEQIVQDETSGY